MTNDKDDKMNQLSLGVFAKQQADKESRIAEVVGDDAGRMGRLSRDVISAAYNDGVLVTLTVRRGRVTERLKAEDLGLSPTKETEAQLRKAASLGSKLLLPKEIVSELKSIEQAGRTALKRHSFETLFGHFVPCTAYAAWKEEYEVNRQRYYEVRNRAIADHDEIVQGMYELWLELAPDLYRGAHLGADPPAGYAEEIAERMASKVLTREKIAESFSFDQTISRVPIPSEVEADMLDRERAARARRLGKERAELVEEYEKDLEAVYAERKDTVNAFADSIIAQMSQNVVTMCADIYKVLKGKRVVASKTADKLRRLITEVRTCNFVDDEVTSERLDDVEKALESADCTPETLAKVLQDVHTQALKDLDDDTVDNPEYALVWHLDDETVA